MSKRFLAAGVLSAILISLAPTPATQINNSTTGTKVQPVQVQAPRKESTADKPEITGLSKTPTEQETVEEPEFPKAEQEPAEQTATCADEVAKHDWNKDVALAVMHEESRGNPDNHNDDPSTGDYSIGCFQINLLGDSNLRAKYRDATRLGYTGDMSVAGLEKWLKNAKNNVAVAHIMWSDQGWNPWGATTCAYKVQCY